MTSHKELLPEVIELSKKAGVFIKTEGSKFDKAKIEHKGYNNLVSYVDKEAEVMIVNKLSAILPEAGFVTEEGTVEKKGKRFNWVIDPLDGTTNFMHGLPVFSVSIALMDQDDVVLGVIYEPNLDECFYATKGGKAFLNGKEISVSPASSLGECLLATGFPYYDFEKMKHYLAIINEFMRTTHGLRRMGSAAVDLAYVACGRFEGFFEYNLHAWDVAAGALIVQEAGGKVTDFKGGSDFIFGRELVSASGGVHSHMLKTIQHFWNNE